MNNKGRKPKYLTIEKFLEWKANEWAHLVSDVRWLKWIGRAILLAIIAKLIIDFL